MNKIDRAFMVAEKAHANQSYDNIYPYTYHLREVYETAKSFLPKNNKAYEDVLVAAILHDVLEDTHLSYADIKNAFGDSVAFIVYHLTDELGMNRAARKRKTYYKLKNNVSSVFIKVCDRIANVSHSKKYGNDKLLKMYKGEAKVFFDELYFVDESRPELEKAWNEFKKILTV